MNDFWDSKKFSYPSNPPIETLDQAWFVAEIVSGRVNKEDYLRGKVFYCEDCSNWHTRGVFTSCDMQKFIDDIRKKTNETTYEAMYVSNNTYKQLLEGLGSKNKE